MSVTSVVDQLAEKTKQMARMEATHLEELAKTHKRWLIVAAACLVIGFILAKLV